MSQNIIVPVPVDDEVPCEAGGEQEDMDESLEPTVEADSCTPEEAGYGHGV